MKGEMKQDTLITSKNYQYQEEYLGLNMSGKS